jgi:hypothetical protein
MRWLSITRPYEITRAEGRYRLDDRAGAEAEPEGQSVIKL